MVTLLFVFPSHRQIIITLKKAPPRLKSPIWTRSHTRIENQKSQQATVSAAEFNEMKMSSETSPTWWSWYWVDLRIEPLYQLPKIVDLRQLFRQKKPISHNICPHYLYRSICRNPCLLWRARAFAIWRRASVGVDSRQRTR